MRISQPGVFLRLQRLESSTGIGRVTAYRRTNAGLPSELFHLNGGHNERTVIRVRF